MASDYYDGGTCPCGGAWFELAPAEHDEGTLMAVCIDRDGMVTGYTGQLLCIDCSEPFKPRPRLELVQ